MSIYSVRNCRFRYADGAGKERPRPAVDIDSADFEAGKIHVLLGPNGSGKTTLLKMFNNLLTPDRGAVSFKGTPVEKSGDVRLQTVYVHQNPLLLTGSVYDNIAYGLKVRGRSRARIAERVRETLAVVGLEEFGRRRSTALSGGELQRVAIARALVLEPEVLFLDEPTSSVDRNSVARIEEILMRIKNEFGCTVFITTHNLPFAYRICDRLIHMEEGRIMPPSENILRGTTSGSDTSYRIFSSAGVDIFCPLMNGDFKTAVIDYDEIILSRQAVATSARNNLEGTICGFTPSRSHPGQVDVRICVKRGGNELYLSSRVTEQSLRELGLEENGPVFLAFKASAVRLY